MKKTTATVLSLTLLALSSVVASDQPHGSSWKEVKVAAVTAYTAGGPSGKGYVVVTFSSNGTGTPGCASGYPRDLVIDISTPGGGFAAAIAQSAKLSGMSVTVAGTGTCGVASGTETMASIIESAGFRD